MTDGALVPDRPTRQPDTTPAPGPYRPGYGFVAEQILQLITELELWPGDRMPKTENELAARMGTSRTVVREAVKILSAIGRVRAHKGRGLYVADDEGMLGSSRWGGFFLPTNLDHVYMLFEFRRVQETAASRLAATHATPAELRAIGATADTCRQGHLTDQPALFERGDEEFPPRGRVGVPQPVPRRRRARPVACNASPAPSGCTAPSAGTRPRRSTSPRDLRGDPRRRPRSRRRGRRRAHRQHPAGLPARDPAPPLRLTRRRGGPDPPRDAPSTTARAHCPAITIWTRSADVCYKSRRTYAYMYDIQHPGNDAPRERSCLLVDGLDHRHR